jgi:Na+-transporting methylmalonyl-CoA/oxaloacetate decarboxylase gamma subunit
VTDFQVGLAVSGIGITITFFALLVFIGVIVLLQKLFPPKKEKNEIVVEAATIEDQPKQTKTQNDDAAIAVAIAAAAYMRSRRSGQLGATLLAGPGPYRTSR